MITRTITRLALATGFIALALFAASCQPQEKYYAREDFLHIKKMDTHVHLNADDPALVKQAIADNFELLTINVDYPDFPPAADQYDRALAFKTAFPDTVHFAATFAMAGWGEPDYIEKAIAHLQDAREHGAVAVKVWKNVGMVVRDDDGQLVMIDDVRLDPIFSFLESANIPLIGHQGEPYNCWLPLDEMTVNNDREYFREHPEYHMFLHPDMPGYEAQMSARDQRLRKNSKMRFVGAHLASLEWSVDELAAFLDQFPLASVDMAARFGQLQSQSQQDRARVREFFIRYQDRLIYASDLTHQPGDDSIVVAEDAHAKWIADWLYLSSDEIMTVPEIDGEFSGLKLPSAVLDKIYYSNARAVFTKACSGNPAEKGCIQ